MVEHKEKRIWKGVVGALHYDGIFTKIFDILDFNIESKAKY